MNNEGICDMSNEIEMSEMERMLLRNQYEILSYVATDESEYYAHLKQLLNRGDIKAFYDKINGLEPSITDNAYTFVDRVLNLYDLSSEIGGGFLGFKYEDGDFHRQCSNRLQTLIDQKKCYNDVLKTLIEDQQIQPSQYGSPIAYYENILRRFYDTIHDKYQINKDEIADLLCNVDATDSSLRTKYRLTKDEWEVIFSM